jgi:hypothetical protein
MTQNALCLRKMQSSALASKKEKEKGTDSISETIRAITQGKKLEIQTFKLTSERLENGVSIEFQMRATISFNDDT